MSLKWICPECDNSYEKSVHKCPNDDCTINDANVKNVLADIERNLKNTEILEYEVSKEYEEYFNTCRQKVITVSSGRETITIEYIRKNTS